MRYLSTVSYCLPKWFGTVRNKWYDYETVLVGNTKPSRGFAPNFNCLLLTLDTFSNFSEWSVPNLKWFRKLKRIRNLSRFRNMYETFLGSMPHLFFQCRGRNVLTIRSYIRIYFNGVTVRSSVPIIMTVYRTVSLVLGWNDLLVILCLILKSHTEPYRDCVICPGKSLLWSTRSYD